MKETGSSLEWRAMSRRQLLQRAGIGTMGLFGAGLLAACGNEDTPSNGGSEAAASEARVSTRLNWVKNNEYAGYYIAESEGYFAQENITPVVLGGGPNASLSVAAVAGGQVNVGIQAALRQVMLSIIEGADLVMFATIYQRSPFGIMSLPDNPITTAEDLVGKRIGTPNFSRPNIDAIFKVNGLPVDYEFVPVGFEPQPLLEGQVDALEVFVSSQPLVLDQQGVEYVVTTYADLGYEAYANLLLSRRDYLESHREELARYLRAVVKGWEHNSNDPELGARLAVEEFGADLGLDYETELAANKAQLPFIDAGLAQEKGLMWIDLEELEGSMYQGLEGSGVTGLPDAESVIDTEILAMAFDGETSLLNA